MSIEALAAELIAGHPVTSAYNADSTIARSQLYALNIIRNRTSMTGSEILNAIDAIEWGTRTAEQKQTIWDVVHIGQINPFGVEATLIQDAFSAAGGVTIAALQAARVETVSQVTALGLGRVGTGNIEQARS